MAQRCMRCQSKLNHGYCAGCGINYGGSAKERIAKSDIETEKTLERNRFWRMVARWFFWWRIR